MKVFYFEPDWWIAKDLEDAVDLIYHEVGHSKEEVRDNIDALDDSQLRNLDYYPDHESMPNFTITFKERLDQLLQKDENYTGILATELSAL